MFSNNSNNISQAIQCDFVYYFCVDLNYNFSLYRCVGKCFCCTHLSSCESIRYDWFGICKPFAITHFLFYIGFYRVEKPCIYVCIDVVRAMFLCDHTVHDQGYMHLHIFFPLNFVMQYN